MKGDLSSLVFIILDSDNPLIPVSYQDRIFPNIISLILRK